MGKKIINNPYYYAGKGFVSGGIFLFLGPLSGGGLTGASPVLPLINGTSLVGNALNNTP